MTHPCLACGACCATFRVSFYWAEAEDAGGTVPADLTVKVSPYHLAMRGTHLPVPRCVALTGTVGKDACCSIYAARPSPCREFEPAWENGQPHERCDRARAGFGLPPLGPGDFGGQDRVEASPEPGEERVRDST